MVKILSKSGDSLADLYDVKGSIAGIDQLHTNELPIVHEMGQTVFSERLSADIRRATSGAIAQSTAWDVVITNLPNVPTRVLGAIIFADDGANVLRATLSIRDPLDEREIPILVWDTSEEIVSARLQDDGAAIGSVDLLVSPLNPFNLPTMLIGSDQPQPVNEIAFRGNSSAFGAGTVTVTALIYNAFAQIGGISSRGLPIPGW